MTLPPSDEPLIVQPSAELAVETQPVRCSSNDLPVATDPVEEIVEPLPTDSGPHDSSLYATIAEEPPLFAGVVLPQPPQPVRIPHLGHVALVAAYLALSLFATSAIFRIAVHFHFFHVYTLKAAVEDIHYTLGSEILLYFFAFTAAYLTFPLIWGKSLFAGLQWNGTIAFRHRWALIGTGFCCYVLAMLNIVFVPGPSNTPIEKVFKQPGAAWLLFFFGVTIAPFFEELFFRGFLLPAMCTAFDWIAEKFSHNLPIAPAGSRPQWSLIANMNATTVLLSLPAAFFAASNWRGGQFKFTILVPYSAALLSVILFLAMRETKFPHSHLPVDASGNPIWSLPSLVVASVFTSIPFAAMHAEQTGNSVDAVLLLACVSLVLCAVRLVTRSLASSVLVHSFYNFLLFSAMLASTGGFRHLDKM
jgi:membrane protease YdiL (CAAX protease family)